MDPRWMSLIPPLPPLFIPPFHSLGAFSTLPSLPFFPTFKTEQKLSIDRSKRFLVEQLLPSEDEKQPPNTENTPKSLQPVLPSRSVEFVNGGYGVKNPLAICTTRDMDNNTLTEEGNFPCRICGKKFPLQRLLNRHSKCHSDLKRYLCTFCGKGFNDTFDLKRHTRTHTGVRPYKCEQCEKSFTQRCSLESHLRKVHGVAHSYGYKERRSKVFVCEECGFTSQLFDVYVSHLKLLHPFSSSLLRLSAPPKKYQAISPSSSITSYQSV